MLITSDLHRGGYFIIETIVIDGVEQTETDIHKYLRAMYIILSDLYQ